MRHFEIELRHLLTHPLALRSVFCFREDYDIRAPIQNYDAFILLQLARVRVCVVIAINN